MAATKGGTDQFANLAVIQVTESAPNTLTFKKLETGISLSEKVAWIINRIEWFFTSPLAAVFNGDADMLEFGLSVGNTFATASITESTILDYNTIQRIDYGAAASGFLHERPTTKDLSTLPGGGMIVPPVPFYAFAKGTGLVSAATVTARLSYTLLQLSVDQYWELVEARRVISS